jgi:DNA (cytosine-5)-methyltransferase 1
MERAGFRCLAAIDFNEEAIATYKANFGDHGLILHTDITKLPPEKLASKLGTKKVDVIAGGPPCQGFSTARQRDGANHGTDRLVEDSRRLLYQEFLNYVEYFEPRVFVMENVLGIQSAAGGQYFTRVQQEARLLGYHVVSQIADAFALGVPQKRRRQLIIGVRNNLPGFFPTTIAPAPRAFPHTTLGAAIGDLPRLAAGHGEETCDYDSVRRHNHLETWGKVARRYLFRVLEINRAKKLTAHRARPHSERDLRDFLLLREGENSANAMLRGVKFEFPYDKTSFKDRYTRQSRIKSCSTIVAHLSKDGLMFIHPTQNRSLTPREAARIQSFPDWFQFPVARTHQFRIIGNAVPPLISEAVGGEILAFFAGRVKSAYGLRQQRTVDLLSQELPRSQRDASVRLQKIAYLDRRQLKLCDKAAFLRGWFALLYLFPDLHPDNALDHGDPNSLWCPNQLALPGLAELAKHRFARSGWPVALELLGREAWRRYEARELISDELYCTQAQKLGLKAQQRAIHAVQKTNKREQRAANVQ